MMKRIWIMLSCFLVALCSTMLHSTSITSAKASAGCVTVYEHIHFKGDSKTFCGSTSYVGNDWNDRISSFKANCSMNSIKVYDNANFDENSEWIQLNGGCRQIDDLTIYHFNDRISSIKIQ
jgi:hypothetical protein